MKAATQRHATRDIVIEEVMPHAPEIVWHALTSGELIRRWLMPNDFEPVVGKRFTFRAKPVPGWDGTVHGEVLEVRPLEKLVYSWKGGSADNLAYAPLDSVVTWTLQAVNGGTRLRLVHSGFRSPSNDFAFSAMSGGWARIVQGLGSVAAELTTGR
ncbi:MAG: SRPBCC domain-containing protein [Hyphomicrobiaceae bacterium]|nr:SRPBCC domain-containing protein [Hyphomicrobiaceae bacterium]